MRQYTTPDEPTPNSDVFIMLDRGHGPERVAPDEYRDIGDDTRLAKLLRRNGIDPAGFVLTRYGLVWAMTVRSNGMHVGPNACDSWRDVLRVLPQIIDGHAGRIKALRDVAPLPADGVEWGARPSGVDLSSPAAEQNACHGGGDA